jgi:hypothetical protein
MADRLQLARESYLAYASGNRARMGAGRGRPRLLQPRGSVHRPRRLPEILSFAGDQIRKAEVYFGWDVD